MIAAYRLLTVMLTLMLTIVIAGWPHTASASPDPGNLRNGLNTLIC
jgi:hypothetical protein